MASPESRRPPSKPTPGGSAVIIISVWPKHKETHWLMYLSSLGMAGSRYVHPDGAGGEQGLTPGTWARDRESPHGGRKDGSLQRRRE